MKLGTLKRIDLHECWKHEAMDFTKWLSEPKNIALLSDEVGIGIEVIQIEASVGRFNVDILAQEENTGKKIVKSISTKPKTAPPDMGARHEKPNGGAHYPDQL